MGIRSIDNNNSCLLYDNYFSAEENSRLYSHALTLEEKFKDSVVARYAESVVDQHVRKSKMIGKKYFPEFAALLEDKINGAYDEICDHLHIDKFDRADALEIYLTAHGHGDFFKPHIDNGTHPITRRVISFVYYFHKEPKPYTGGQLLFLQNQPRPLVIETENNSIVFFDSSLVHAVHPVNCAEIAFENSRFTMNGWISKK